MAKTRMIEVFSAGCAVCTAAIEAIRAEACPSCEIVVSDMHDPQVAQRARALGVNALPAVAIDGVLATCCADRGLDLEALRAAGLGQPMS
jgi:glutaredoxin 3